MKRVIELAAPPSVSPPPLTAVAFAGDNTSGFETSQPSMLAPPTTLLEGRRPSRTPDRRDRAADHHRRGHAARRLSVRGDPRRDRAPDARPGPRRPLRQPRDVARPVPVQLHGAATTPERGEQPERLRQLAGQPARAQPALRGRAEREVRDHERARTSSGSARTTSPTEKEGFDRAILFTNEEAQDWVRRSGVAWDGRARCPAGSSHRRRRDRAGGRGRRARRQERQDAGRSTAWGATTTRTASRSRASTRS